MAAVAASNFAVTSDVPSGNQFRHDEENHEVGGATVLLPTDIHLPSQHPAVHLSCPVL